ncbi:MAG: MGMT family protein [Dongiaceae bacterium]
MFAPFRPLRRPRRHVASYSGRPFRAARNWTLVQRGRRAGRGGPQGIARRIGAPRDARELADACAANRLAILIPCHRVVKKGRLDPATAGASGASGSCSRASAGLDKPLVGAGLRPAPSSATESMMTLIGESAPASADCSPDWYRAWTVV